MRAIVVTCMLAMTGGCFSFWGLTQLTGTQSAWEQNVREETVPQPGVRENLMVSLPLTVQYQATYGATATSPSTPSTAPTGEVVLPFQVSCHADQYATDRVYHSAFRYGSRWKKYTLFSFVAEAAIASTILTFGERDNIKTKMYGGLFAIDALGTIAIFWIPRKEIYRTDDKPVRTALRNDCPDGLVLQIAGDSYPISAAGRIGELGETALDQWMAEPRGTIELMFDGRMMPLQIGANEVCAWNRAHHPTETQACGAYAALPLVISTVLTVPVGTLTAVAAE